jgi:hypothetical protein
MFADTEIPTALALWGPTDTDDDFFVWRKNELIGPFSALAKTIEPTSCAPRIRFNQLDGQIGLKAIDGTGGPSIAFCEPDLIPSAKIKPSARLVSRIKVEDLTIASSVISVANARLRDWRQGTEDVLLTAFKGLRSDDRFRRRLDFANARALLSHALCEVERHDHA